MQAQSQTKATPSIACNALLAAMSPASRSVAMPQLTRVELRAGEVIQQPGQELQSALFPVGTVLAAEQVLRGGQSVLVALVGGEGMAGAELLVEGRRSGGRAMALVVGHAYRLPVRTLKRLLEVDAGFREAAMRWLRRSIADISQIAACNRLHNIEQRFCWLLLSVNRRTGSEEIELTHEQIANLLGVRRESVTVAAANLRRAGSIDYRRGRITLISVGSLADRSCECYETT